MDFEKLLRETMGLDSASVGSTTIESAVKQRIVDLDMNSTEEYWQRVIASGDELQELIEAVVVPETWFFRDPSAFSALARSVSEEMIKPGKSGVLRMLSVPCCSGEEPYSMAMALLDMGLAKNQLEIDAIDISTRALNRAKHAVYGSNSFRSDSLVFRDRHFEQVAKGYMLAERVRDVVTFHHGNLLSLDHFQPGKTYDVIFCRNVLIYFDRATQEKTMNVLRGMLAEGGLLFVGPAEAFLAASTGFRAINQSLSFAFRKEPDPAKQPVEISRPQLRRTFTSAPKRKSLDPVKPVVSIGARDSPVEPANEIARAKCLADAGQLVEASALCEKHLKAHGLSSEGYCLLGLIRDAMGDALKATECYRKALYLEPDNSEALMHLSLLRDKQGHSGHAQRLRARTKKSEESTRG